MPRSNESEYALVLQQLNEITQSVLSDLQQLKTNPLLASSSTSCRYVDQIASKTEEVIQIVNQLSARAILRRKETKSLKHRDAAGVPVPNILQNVSMQQYHDMEIFTKQILDAVELGASLNLPIEKSPHRHASDGHGHRQGYNHRDEHTHKHSHHHHHKHSAWCQRSYRHVIPTLVNWIHLLAEAQHKAPSTVRSDSEHSKMVLHFQKLFDVPTEGGVYTRMNELYSRVGEMQNVLHSLKDILGLDDDASAKSIVTATAQLCELYSSSTTHLLGQLLQQERLDRVITRMEHYRKFFPIFDTTVKDLMEILCVASLDRIVPAVRALKLLNT